MEDDLDWMMIPVPTTNGSGWQMSLGISTLGAPWASWRVRLTRAFQMVFGQYGAGWTECWETQLKVALDKMMMTDQHQHSDGLLQEFYMMTQRTNEPTGKYAIQLNLVADKVHFTVQRNSGWQWRGERGCWLIASLGAWILNVEVE